MPKILNLTDEQKEARKKELARLRAQRFRLRHGDLSVGLGKLKKGETATTTYAGQTVVHRIEKEEKWRPSPETVLTKDSKLEDLLPWAMEVAEELRQTPNPAAWASALNSVLKILEYLDKKIPPSLPDVKPRPRQVIVIEEDEVRDDE